MSIFKKRTVPGLCLNFTNFRRKLSIFIKNGSFSKNKCDSISPIFVDNCSFWTKKCDSISQIFVSHNANFEKKCLGYKDDFLEPYRKFQAAIEDLIQSKCQNLPVKISALERKEAEWEIRNCVMSSFKWQRFFSGDILQKHVKNTSVPSHAQNCLFPNMTLKESKIVKIHLQRKYFRRYCGRTTRDCS